MEPMRPVAGDDGWEARMAARSRTHISKERRAEYEAWAAENGVPIYRSADEVWAAFPDACRDCDEPKPPPPGVLYGWTMWVVCGWQPCRFGHDHHGDEIPIAVG